MLRRQLIDRARILAGRAVEQTLTDRVRIDRTETHLYDGPGRLLFTGKTEVSQGATGTSVYMFAELHLPREAPALDRGDRVTVMESVEPALVGRVGYIGFAEPVTSLTGFQRITIRLAGNLEIGRIV